jgi:hypothetical protein
MMILQSSIHKLASRSSSSSPLALLLQTLSFLSMPLSLLGVGKMEGKEKEIGFITY